MIGVSSPMRPMCVDCGAETSVEQLSQRGTCPDCGCDDCYKGLTAEDEPCSCIAGRERRALERILAPVQGRASELLGARFASAAGMREAADDLIRRAEASEARARELLGSKFAPRHQTEASRLRHEAGSLLKVVA